MRNGLVESFEHLPNDELLIRCSLVQAGLDVFIRGSYISIEGLSGKSADIPNKER